MKWYLSRWVGFKLLKTETLNQICYNDNNSDEVLQNYTLSHKNVYNNVERMKKNVEIHRLYLHYQKGNTSLYINTRVSI